MKLVVGLGNPGSRYEQTRHNAGFRVAQSVAAQHGIELASLRFSGRYGEGTLEGVEFGVLLPQTFVNRSGEAVAAAVAGLAIDSPERDLLLVYDDMDLPLGRIRLRRGGGAGGHNGMADVISCLESRALPRLRFGIGRPPESQDPVDYVLSPFSAQEEEQLVGGIEHAARAVAVFAALDVDAAMNRFNLAPEDLGESEAQ